MKRLKSILRAVLAVMLAVVVRSWILASSQVEPDQPVVPKLSADLDPMLGRIERLRSVHETKRPNQPGDWLDRHPEFGQSFPHYVEFQSRIPLRDKYSVIHIQPLSDFDETQQRIVEQTAEFMEHYFGIEVRVLEPISMEPIPESARRMRNDEQQVLSTWIMHDVLQPRRAPDAMVTIGLVTCDLWPGNLNWVFGHASIPERVAVWSLHRNGDPRESEDTYRMCLRRTLKTGVHETGHALGIPHCVAYECAMNGSRSREENDRQPLEFCPECQGKIWWSCGADPVKRCQALLTFCETHGLDPEADMFRKECKMLSSKEKSGESSNSREATR